MTSLSPQKRLKEIVDLADQRKINLKVQFSVNGRANLIDYEAVKLLKRTGVMTVNMGLESGSERILQYLKGKTATVQHAKKAIKFLRKVRINVSPSFIIGAPLETRDEVLETLRLIRDNDLV